MTFDRAMDINHDRTCVLDATISKELFNLEIKKDNNWSYDFSNMEFELDQAIWDYSIRINNDI